ncbi:hypothetical protein EDD21DRAFT_356667 [Dissophora ornata]|nr:hypothetical protein EDD21DRAFT_356667 [Dissophora ornata]
MDPPSSRALKILRGTVVMSSAFSAVLLVSIYVASTSVGSPALSAVALFLYEHNLLPIPQMVANISIFIMSLLYYKEKTLLVYGPWGHYLHLLGSFLLAGPLLFSSILALVGINESVPDTGSIVSEHVHVCDELEMLGKMGGQLCGIQVFISMLEIGSSLLILVEGIWMFSRIYRVLIWARKHIRGTRVNMQEREVALETGFPMDHVSEDDYLERA